MFGIGGFELFLILLFGFLIFGPDKLPAMAKTIGAAIAKFKSAQEEMNKVIKTEVYDPTSDEPFKNPLEALAKVGDIAKKDEKSESFSERKARYDKERAAKKAAESDGEEELSEVAVAASAKSTTSSTTAKVGTAAKATTNTTAKDASAAAKRREIAATKPKLSPEEMYGTKTTSTAKATTDKATAEKPATTAKATTAKSSAAKSTTAKSTAAKPAAAKKTAKNADTPSDSPISDQKGE